MSLYGAEERGLFRDENLDNEVIAMGGPAGIAALVNGSIDFSGIAGIAIKRLMQLKPVEQMRRELKAKRHQ
ncbi:MAG: hypothetical protein EXR70_01230 [Deltaproteobacteria bacterium]|nr:hypothetical protein [Deltaproteobacteria bacterium]